MSEGGGGGGPGLGAVAAGIGAGVAVGAAARVELRLSLALQKSVAGLDCYIKLKSRSGMAEMRPCGKFSIFDLMKLSTMHGPVIQVWCSGPDQELAFERLEKAIENGDLVADRFDIEQNPAPLKPPKSMEWMFDEQIQMKGLLTLDEAQAVERSLSAADRRKMGTLKSEKWWRLVHLSEEKRAEELARIEDPAPEADVSVAEVNRCDDRILSRLDRWQAIRYACLPYHERQRIARLDGEALEGWLARF